jgi:Amt family ammonium transporter
MCLNASLAGLVAITASCDVTDALGSMIIGAVSGVLVVFGVWLLDYVLRIDDPVGAVAVHFMNGVWGTFATGLFATSSAPGYSIVDKSGKQLEGLFYGGGFKLLGLQCLGILTVGAWTAVTITIVFLVIKATVGLRVTEEEEILGLDATEHGLETAYAGFLQSGMSSVYGDLATKEDEDKKVSVDDAVPVQILEDSPVASDVKISKVDIICKQNKFEELKEELNAIGVMGITVTQVLGCGAQKGNTKYYRGVEMDMVLLPKVKVEVVVSKVPVKDVVKAAKKALYTGNIGDGKVFVYGVENVIKVRTGEQGFDALQGDDDLTA